MASGNHILCGPCMFDDVTKDSGRWCTSCEEGLCEDCENLHRKSKTSRNHKVITIENYRKIENVSISQVCEHHGENLEWFCKSHDEVLCVVCVPSKHKACSDVIPIVVNSANSRQSSALFDLEKMIEVTLRNVKQCIQNREFATQKIEKRELDVKTMVLETREKINSHLDKLQEKLLLELRSSSHTCKLKYMNILQKLKSTEEMLTKLREQTRHMKQFSSDIQVFLGTRQVNKRIVSEIKFIKSEISVTKDYELKVSLHSLIEKLSKDVEDFGKIRVTELATNLDFRNQKIEQAQIEINVPPSRNIFDIKLQPIKSFQMKSAYTLNVTGCVILPNGHLLMASDADYLLFEHSNTGEHIRDIRVSFPPYDIALIDLNHIVVTYGAVSLLEIMNSKTFNVEKKIKLSITCGGVSYNDGRIYVMGGLLTRKIQVLDLSGRQLETLKISSDCVLNITTTRDKMFYTDYNESRIHCCCLNGEDLWQVESDSMLYPKGLTVDNNDNIYVVSYRSKNLRLIQQDGKNSKTLLTESDGLNGPKAVDFDTNTNTLLVCNEEGYIALYKVV